MNCWRCRGNVVLDVATARQVKKVLSEAYTALPVEGNEYVLNRINEVRNILSVVIFQATVEEDMGG